MRRSLAVLAILVLYTGTAHAANPDTAYGRIDGDLSVSAAVGATFAARSPRAAVDLRLRYLWTAGIFGTYEDGFGGSSEPKRLLATGIELRPLFLAKWLQGRETGHPYVDLTIDSLGLELGAVFQQPQGTSFASKPGLQASLGLQIPIFPNATGPTVGVHAGARWSNTVLSGGDPQSAADRSAFVLLTLGWQQVFGAHVVDFNDR